MAFRTFSVVLAPAPSTKATTNANSPPIGADDEPIEAHASSVSVLHQNEEEQADHEARHKERRHGQELLGGPRGFSYGKPETTQHPQGQVEPEDHESTR